MKWQIAKKFIARRKNKMIETFLKVNIYFEIGMRFSSPKEILWIYG